MAKTTYDKYGQPMHAEKKIPAYLVPYKPNPIDSYDSISDGRFTKQRKVYLYLKQTLASAPTLEYLQGMKKLRGQIEEYRKFKIEKVQLLDITKTDKNIRIEEIRAVDEDALWSEAVIEFDDVVESFIEYYEELDAQINEPLELDEDGEPIEDRLITEDMFNYKGYSRAYRYLTWKVKSQRIDPDFNEHARWLYILEGLSDSEITKLHNPFVKKLILDKMFVHPMLGFTMDYELTGRSNESNLNQSTKFNKRFDKAFENLRAAKKGNKLLPIDNTISANNIGYLDGEEYLFSVRMYLWANRYASRKNKYRQNITITGASMFSGYHDLSSLTKRRGEWSEMINVIEAEIANAQDNYGGTDDYEFIVEHLQKLYEGYSKMLRGISYITAGVSVIAEEILLNPHAGNATGALHTAKYAELGSWFERQDTPEPSELVITFNSTEFKS